MAVNEKLKQRRLELHLTLEQVADKVGVAKSTVHRWECGYISNMKCDKIQLLAQALNVSPAFILDCADFEVHGSNNGIIGNNNSNNSISVSNNDMNPIISTIAVACSYLSKKDQQAVLKYATDLLYNKEEDK